MSERILANCVVVLAGMTLAVTAAAQEKEIERWKHSTWQMALNLDTPNLVPPAVQYSVFDKDPIPGFKASLERMKSYHEKELDEDETEANRKLARSSYLTVNWDRRFKEVTGDKVYLLTSAPGVSHSLSSNTQDGKKWLVTKIVRIKGVPVCWCLPVETKTGERIDVVVTEKNAFHLEAVYDETMRASSQSKDEPIDGQIAKLQAERIETLQQVVRELETMHRDGHGDKLRIHAARSDLIEAQLELATTKAERLALLRKHLELAKFGEEFAEAQYRAGLRSHVECLQAKATRLQREIAVVRETGD